MKNMFQNISAVLMVVAVSVALVAMPAAHTAVAFDFGSGFDSSSVNTNLGFENTSNFSFTECVLTVDRDEIYTGENVTLTWETTGFTDITLNGDTLNGNDGSITIENLQENTTYKLQALNEQGASCVSSVTVTCLPPPDPEFCELEITKDVDKTTANIGDELTYTINIKNVGDADCTDVVVTDVLDDWFGYTGFTYTSSFMSGNGTHSAAGNTFTFEAGVMNPNDTGSVVIFGDVLDPNQCGDFVIENQAKVTADEITGYEYSQKVTTAIDNDCQNPAPECTLTPTLQYIDSGDTATLTWTTENATAVTLTSFGSVELDGTREVGPLTADTSYVLTATGPDGEVTCPAEVKINPDVPVPSCDLFVANPDMLMVGATSTLTWETSNATKVTINNTIGEVAEDGNREITPTQTTTYVMTVEGTNGQQVTCEEVVTVSEYPVPSCDLFEISPDVITSGGTATINWETTNATRVVINNGIGDVSDDGNREISPLADTTYIMTVFGQNNQEITCQDTITVNPEQEAFSCANNVSFSASDRSIRRGEDITLNWTVTDADSVALNGSTVSASDSRTVSPSSDTTYTITATRGNDTISCPLSVDVSTGGGGGGSASPRCELEISDKKISSGEEITITWETSSAREVTLIDDRDNILFTTDDYLASDKEEYYDGEITLKPTRDTEYTLIAERGTRDRECRVEVEVEDDVVVIETRDQQPLVSGIALTQVPYTGFEAGPILTALFYMLLIAWSLFITYLIVIRGRTPATAPVEVFMTQRPTVNEANIVAMKKAEGIRPDVFTAATSAAATTTAPSNLPTATDEPVIGYSAAQEHQVSDAVVTQIENRAHQQKALLSSDAVRYFISTTEGSVERNEALDTVIAEAKTNYPLEDGWIVVNEARMRHLCDTCLADTAASNDEPFIPATVPEGTGSLAEAIVTGNVVAAYEMIGSRPMFALADASADLDAVYRARKGEQVAVSDMLATETAKLSDEQLNNMISALTGALDGTYTDEASAVKMAIMKAVKVVG